jgi:hypothetical protein
MSSAYSSKVARFPAACRSTFALMAAGVLSEVLR